MPESLSAAELAALGLSPGQARKLADEVHALCNGSPEQSWSAISKQLLPPDLPPAVYDYVHRFVFRSWPAERGLAPAWFPTTEIAGHANVTALLAELGLGTYQELYAWSIAHRSEFWGAMIRRLGIQFRSPYSQVLDPGVEPQQVRWFLNARLNIADSCFQAASDAVAIYFGREDGTMVQWTYGELAERVARIVAGLERIGLAPGDAVAIDMPMTAESLAIYLGIVSAGCVAVSIADSFAAGEIATRLRVGRAKAIFTQDELAWGGKRLPLYARVCAAQAPQAIVLSCDDSRAAIQRQGDLSWHDFLSSAGHRKSVARLPADHTGYLFSSGTTGQPKAVPWTHVTPIKCATDGFVHQDIQPRDVVCWPTNLGWMMGPWLIYASLINRATIALFYGAPSGRAFGQFVERAGVTMLGVIPSLVANWKNSGCMAGLDWSAIRRFSSTGECSNADDMLWLMARAGQKPVIEYCGGTELGGGYLAGTMLQPQAPAAFSTPTIGTQLIIADETGRPAENGELFLVPPAIGMSNELINGDHAEVYYHRAPTGPEGEGLRRHGDQVERLPGGYYRVHGRTDDTMNLGGIKVSSAEIERVLSQVPGVRETAAIAVAPPGGGPSRLVIFVVLASGSCVATSDLSTLLREAVRRDLNPLFHVHDVVIVESLPRTASNKIMRRVLRARYQDPDHEMRSVTPIAATAHRSD